MKDIKQLVSEAKRLEALSFDRALEISRTKTTDIEYLELEERIKNASERMKEIAGDNQYTSDYQNALSELREAMTTQDVHSTEGAKLKFRETKKVNALAVRVTLDDEDQFMSLVEIPQSKLKEFMKDNETLKKPLQSCIEVIDRKVTDIELT